MTVITSCEEVPSGEEHPSRLNLDRPVCVFQDWIFALPMQQQSVLVLALRGPDGIAKHHPAKRIIRHYRAAVLKAAYLGRPMRAGEGDDTTFMDLLGFDSDWAWELMLKDWFDYVDSIPHHYYLHLVHGAQIAGYKMPSKYFRDRWREFYYRACVDLHVNPETEAQMDKRLCDWNRAHWE